MRLAQVTEDPSGLRYATIYAYDVQDNLTGVDQGSVDQSFAYDTLGRLRSAMNPESAEIKYTYFRDGLLETREVMGGVTLTNNYNFLGQRTTQTYTDSTPAVTFEYGTASPSNDFGGSSGFAHGVTTKEYGYD